MQVTQAIRPLPFSISYQSAQAHQSIARRILLQPPTELSLLAFLATYEKQIPIARKAYKKTGSHEGLQINQG